MAAALTSPQQSSFPGYVEPAAYWVAEHATTVAAQQLPRSKADTTKSRPQRALHVVPASRARSTMQASVPLEQPAGVRRGHSRPRDDHAQFAVRLNHSVETF